MANRGTIQVDDDEVLLAQFERELSTQYNFVKEKRSSSEHNEIAFYGITGQKLVSIVERIISQQELAKYKRENLLLNYAEKFYALKEFQTSKYFFYDMLLSSTFSISSGEIQIRAMYGSALSSFHSVRDKDPRLLFPGNLEKMLDALQKVQQAMEIALDLEMKTPQRYAWLLLNGTIIIYTIAKPLQTLGFEQEVVPYFKWCILVLECNVTFCTTKYIIWRVQLYNSVCECYEANALKDSSKSSIMYKKALQSAVAAQTAVLRLRKEEELDLPIPKETDEILKKAQTATSLWVILLKARTNGDTITKKFLETNVTNQIDRVRVIVQVLEHLNKGDKEAVGALAKPKHPQIKAEVNELLGALYELLSPFLNTIASGDYSTMDNNFFPLSLHMSVLKHFYRAERFQELTVILEAVEARTKSRKTKEDNTISLLFQMIQGEVALYRALSELSSHKEKNTPFSWSKEHQKLLSAVNHSLRQCLYMGNGKFVNGSSDILSSAALWLYHQYILPACDQMDGISKKEGNDFVFDTQETTQVAFLSELLLSVHLVFNAVELDDILLRGLVCLRLVTCLRLQKKFRGGIQVIRKTLDVLSERRDQTLQLDNHLQLLQEDLNQSFALQSSSFTAHLDASFSFSDAFYEKNVRNTVGVKRTGSQLGTLLQEIACLQTDLSCLLFQLEILEAQHVQSLLASVNDHSNLSIEKETPKEDFVVQMETKLIQECRKNGYLKTILNLQRLLLVPKTTKEQHLILEETFDTLKKCESQEKELLQQARNHLSQLQQHNSKSIESEVPLVPIILSRSSSSVFLRIQPFVSCHPSIKKKEIAYYMVFAKPAGAGTDVSLNNTQYPGTGMPVYASSSSEMNVKISGLIPNESYVFAVAAFDKKHQVLQGIGATTSRLPVVALHPLSIPLLYGNVAKVCFLLGKKHFARKNALLLYQTIVSFEINSSKTKRNTWQSHCFYTNALKRVVLGRFPMCFLHLSVQVLTILSKEDEEIDQEEKQDETIQQQQQQQQQENSLTSFQLSRLEESKKMLIALEIACTSSHLEEAIINCCYKIYRLLLPLFRLSSTNGLLLEPLLTIFTALELIALREKKKIDQEFLQLQGRIGFELFRLSKQNRNLFSVIQSVFIKDVWNNFSLQENPFFFALSETLLLDQNIITTFSKKNMIIWKQKNNTNNSTTTSLDQILQQSKFNVSEALRILTTSQPNFQEEIESLEKMCKLYRFALKKKEDQQILNHFRQLIKIKKSFKNKNHLSPYFFDTLKKLGIEEEILVMETVEEATETIAFSSTQSHSQSQSQSKSQSDLLDVLQKEDKEAIITLTDSNNRSEHDTYLFLWIGEFYLLQVVQEFQQIFKKNFEKKHLEMMNVLKGPNEDISYVYLHPEQKNEQIQKQQQQQEEEKKEKEEVKETMNHFFQVLKKASIASECFFFSNAWQSLQATCQYVWNTCWSCWTSPSSCIFSTNPQALNALLICGNRLLDMLEAFVLKKKTEMEQTQKMNHLTKSTITNGKENENKNENFSIESGWVSEFIGFILQVCCHQNAWQQLVDLGRRFHMVSTHCLLSDKNSQVFFPLVLFAQKQLCQLEEKQLTIAQQELTNLITNFELYQAKTKKKKNKNNTLQLQQHQQQEVEPLLRNTLEETISLEEKKFHEKKLHKKQQIQTLELKFTNLSKILQEMDQDFVNLQKSTNKCFQILLKNQLLLHYLTTTNNATSSSSTSTNMIIKNYLHCIHLSRQKKMSEITCQAMEEMGDFYFFVKDFSSAMKYWNEVIDNCFQMLDAIEQWKQLSFFQPFLLKTTNLIPPTTNTTTGTEILSTNFILGSDASFRKSWSSISSLLKLLLNTTDSHKQLDMALMGAHWITRLFETSLPHPNKNFLYGTYKLEQHFWPNKSLFPDTSGTKPCFFTITLACMIFPELLLQQELAIEALPSIVLYEFIAKNHLQNENHVGNAKRMKMEALLQRGKYQEALQILEECNINNPVPKFDSRKSLFDVENQKFLQFLTTQSLDIVQLIQELKETYTEMDVVLKLAFTIIKVFVRIVQREETLSTQIVSSHVLKMSMNKIMTILLQEIQKTLTKLTPTQSPSASTDFVSSIPQSPRTQVLSTSSSSSPRSPSLNQTKPTPPSTRPPSANSQTPRAKDQSQQQEEQVLNLVTSSPLAPNISSGRGGLRHLYGEVLLLQSELAFAEGNWQVSRSLSLQAMEQVIPRSFDSQKIENPLGLEISRYLSSSILDEEEYADGIPRLVTSSLGGFISRCRLQLIRVDFVQANYSRVLTSLSVALEETEMTQALFYRHKLLIVKIQTLLMIGKRQEAHQQVNALYESFIQHQVITSQPIEFITVLQLRAHLNHLKSVFNNEETETLMLVLKDLLFAEEILDFTLNRDGWIGVEHRKLSIREQPLATQQAIAISKRINCFFPLLPLFIQLKASLALALLQTPLADDETQASRIQKSVETIESGLAAFDHVTKSSSVILGSSKALLLLLQATLKRKTKAIGCLKVELVEEIAVLLRQSIQVCMTEASHERNLIRAALIELVELYGGTQLENETENQRKTHMQAAFYYLNLALTIQAQQTFIMETFELQNATAPASMANNLDKLPVFITNELFPRSGSSGSIPIVVDSVALVNYFLRVQKEKNLLPIGLNDFQNEIAHILHVFFLQNHPLYLKQCCLQVLGQVPKEDPQLSAGFILLHYGKNICPVLVQAQEKQQDKTCEIPPKGSKIAFDNTVNVYFTLGTTALPEGGHNVNNEPSNTRLKVFAATPYLSKRNGLDSKKLKEFKQRLSQLRIEIEDSQDGSLLVPKAQPFASIQVFEKVFVEILRDIQVFFASSSSSTRVSSTTNCTTSSTSLVDTYGNTFMVPCTVETVSIVEKICQCDDGGAGNGGGIQTIEKSICYFLRDLFEQMGE